MSKAILYHDVVNSDHTNMSAVLLLLHVVSCGTRYVSPCARRNRRVSLQDRDGRVAQLLIDFVYSSQPYRCIG
jgi:hypothetical protein